MGVTAEDLHLGTCYLAWGMFIFQDNKQKASLPFPKPGPLVEVPKWPGA